MVKELSAALTCLMCVHGVIADVPVEYYSVATSTLATVDDALLPTTTIMTGAMKMQYLIDEAGWTSNQVAEVATYIVTNTTPENIRGWRRGIVFDGALHVLVEFGGTEVVQILESYIDKADRLKARQVVREYALKRGFGHDAFEKYKSIVFSPDLTNTSWIAYRFDGLYDAFSSVKGTAAETNRFMELELRMEELEPMLGTSHAHDMIKCEMWPGYSTSSNRYLYVSEVLHRCRPGNVSNYFHHAKLELDALPPGTMQMLSTNQFYNVEE